MIYLFIFLIIMFIWFLGEMMDLINKHILIEQLQIATVNGLKKEFQTGLLEAQRIVKNMPVEQKLKGHWEYKMKPTYNPYCYKCSNCHTSHRAKYNYCPSCGAEMESD